MPEQILRLPGPGWRAFVAALATAIVFGAMTVKLPIVGWLPAWSPPPRPRKG